MTDINAIAERIQGLLHEVSQLVKMLVPPTAEDTLAWEKTEFTVVLTGVVLTASGSNKINVIKAVREITGLGLQESKDLVDGAPKTIKEGVNKDEAETIRKRLVEVGATVEVK